MEPTLQIGDRIVVDKLSYHLHGVGTGDIVVFSTPANEDCAGPPVSDLVKRVIGLPGQTVSLSEGRVYIDGRVCPNRGCRCHPHRDVSRPVICRLLASPSLPGAERRRLRHG